MSTRRVPALTFAHGAIMAGAIVAGATAGPVTAGPTGGALPPALVEVVPVAGQHGVPDDAAMVAVNITATRAAERGYFTAFPCDGDLPTASNVNFLADQNVPNLALVRIADDGTICIATSAVADLVVDVVGHVPAGSAIAALSQPVRVVDTRDTRTLAAGDTLRIPVAAIDGVDPDADLVMVNVTAIARGDTGYLTTHPCLTPTPGTSSVNFGPGQTNANFVTSRIAPSGDICITTSQPADVIVDVAASAVAGITPLAAPVRLLDTRPTGQRPAGSTLTLDIAARPDIPDDASAAVYNLTAANAAEVGYATSHPCLDTPPTASNLNYAAGPPRANGTITKLSPTGRLCITTSHQVDLIVDLIGYTTGITHYVPLTPVRIVDTRTGWEPACDLSLLRSEDPARASAPWYVWDHERGELRHLDLPGGEPIVPNDPAGPQYGTHLLSPSCDAVVLHQLRSAGRDDYWVAPVDGGRRHRLELFDEDAVVNPLGVTVDGRLIGVDAGGDPDLTVFDLLNGDILLQLDGMSSSFGAVQMTRHGDRFAVQFHDQTDGTLNLAVYDVDAFDATSVIENFDTGALLSPDGKYLVHAEPGSSSSTSTVVVSTSFGDEVFRRPDAILTGWAGAGTLLIDDVVPLSERVGPGTIVSPGAVDWVRSLLPVYGMPEELTVPRSARVGSTEVRQLVFVDHW